MVKLSLEMKKRDFVWIGLIAVLLGAGLVFAQWDSAKAMFHNSEDVKITIGGEDYSLQNASDLGLIGGGMGFGNWEIKNENQDYPSNTDGFVVIMGNKLSTGFVIGETPVGNIVSEDYVWGGATGSVTFPVKKGNTWKAKSSTGVDVIDKVWWVPIISSGGSSGDLDCYIEESILSNPIICCNSGYFATGVNSPELDSQSYWDNPQCIRFVAAASSNLKQVMCCK